MTVEQKAEEYAGNTSGLDISITLMVAENKTDAYRLGRYDGFLAGLKAGRPQWHNINDTEPSKEQLGKQLLIRMESVIGDTDYDYLVYKYTGESITDVPDVIAWCEIPTFDKE